MPQLSDTVRQREWDDELFLFSLEWIRRISLLFLLWLIVGELLLVCFLFEFLKEACCIKRFSKKFEDDVTGDDLDNDGDNKAGSKKDNDEDDDENEDK